MQKRTMPARLPQERGVTAEGENPGERGRREEEDRGRSVEEDPRDDRQDAVVGQDRPREDEVERVRDRVSEKKQVAANVLASPVESLDADEHQRPGGRQEDADRRGDRQRFLLEDHGDSEREDRDRRGQDRRVDRGGHRKARMKRTWFRETPGPQADLAAVARASLPRPETRRTPSSKRGARDRGAANGRERARQGDLAERRKQGDRSAPRRGPGGPQAAAGRRETGGLTR